MSATTRLARWIFLELCSRIEVGGLRISTPDGRERVFGDELADPQAELHVRDESFFRDMLTQGDWGLGWAYVHKKWDSKQPRNVPLIFMLNEPVFRPWVRLGGWLSPTMRAVERASRRNQRREEEVRRRTLSECYDVGNEFYEWMLGPTMAYSCAIWPRANATLEEAQENKMRLVTEKARIEPQHRVLELGCGWGSLSDYIRRNTGAKVKGIAFARNQIEWAKRHYSESEYEYRNYENIEGEWDRIVSVGMAEHVGRPNLRRFLRLVSAHLVPGGRFVMHTMCSHDGILMASSKKRWTAFASVAMPNGDVPSMTDIVRATLATASMRIVHTEGFGIHYARTGKAWLENLERHRDRIIERYSEEFYRTYVYSFCMGGAAFETGLTVVHVVFEKRPFGAPTAHLRL